MSLFEVALLGLLGSMCWVFLTRFHRTSPTPKKQDFLHRPPTQSTWITGAIAGLLFGIAASLLWSASPRLLAFMFAYVATDLLNSLSLIVLKRRM